MICHYLFVKIKNLDNFSNSRCREIDSLICLEQVCKFFRHFGKKHDLFYTAIVLLNLQSIVTFIQSNKDVYITIFVMVFNRILTGNIFQSQLLGYKLC